MGVYRPFGVVLLVSWIFGNNASPISIADEKVCLGTDYRLSTSESSQQHYNVLKNRYRNCTYIDGNLELTWLNDPSFNLDFLQDIREVTGYVLIGKVDLQRVILPRLQIIRGGIPFKLDFLDEEFGLMVTLSNISSLELPALRDVSKGSIAILQAPNLCHIKTIDWREIMSDPNGRFVYNSSNSSIHDCPPCHKNCAGGCWGEGEENCQKLPSEICSPDCSNRCYGNYSHECCDTSCAGGCTGPKPSDCVACKNFYDDGICRDECPPLQTYNPLLYSWQPNPKGKYAYGTSCVEKCPSHLLVDNGACVRACPPNKTELHVECIPCSGPCPKTCKGDVIVNSGNIDSFKGCTIIEGYLKILETSFKCYQVISPNFTLGERFSPMHPDRLEVFSTLKELTGYLAVEACHEDFKNLSYFRNLEVIDGRELHEYFSSLYIIKTSLKSLNLHSLKRINSGAVVILENEHLCFAGGINWGKIRKSSKHQTLLRHNGNTETCNAAGLVCDDQCTNDGCWGSGADQCLSCSRLQLDQTCFQNCSVIPGLYQTSNNTCERCDQQCESSCYGSGPEHCTACKNFKLGPFCVPKCPDTMYAEKGECTNCHSSCVGGCTGPLNTLGPGGCKSCRKVIINGTFAKCLDKTDPCPDGYYSEWLGRGVPQQGLIPLGGKIICRECHPKCKKCTGYGFHESVCQECNNYKRNEVCEEVCPLDSYPDDIKKQCIDCDSECRGCTGPGATKCLSCSHYRIYDDNDVAVNATFRCVSTCPPELPLRILSLTGSDDPYCSSDSKLSKS